MRRISLKKITSGFSLIKGSGSYQKEELVKLREKKVNGGSTALWSGGYKTGPGRNIPNAILLVRK